MTVLSKEAFEEGASILPRSTIEEIITIFGSKNKLKIILPKQ